MNTPAEIAELYVMVGDGKTARKSWVLFVLACFAGAFIALGGLGSQIASYGVPSPGLAKFLSGVVFPIGLMMVIVAGGELFTGNCLIFISVLSKNTYLSAMLRSWLVVYLGNAVGAIFVAFLVNYGHVLDMFNNGLAQAVVSTGVAKVNMPFFDAFAKGILCNFMVCLAVWVSFSTEDIAGKIIALYLPIMLFVICSFEHCIANMYFIPSALFAKNVYGIDADGLNLFSFLVKNLLPVTLGNIVGGAVLVGGGYWLVYLTQRDDD